MGYELVSRNYLVPQRLHSLLSTVSTMGELQRANLLALMQPAALLGASTIREQTERLIAAAIRCELLAESEDKARTYRLAVDTYGMSSWDAFRCLMQERILGPRTETEDHFIMNQVAAWVAVQDDKIMALTKSEFERQFNEQIYSGTSERQFSEEPGLTTWLTWAEFLGWGWPTPFGTPSNVRFAPDATVRVRPYLARLLPEAGKTVPFAMFSAELGKVCPELDGGALFEQCWQASRGGEVRGNRLSLMLSTALRTLHKQGAIELIDQPDAPATWTLFPAQSHISRVSHIRREAAA